MNNNNRPASDTDNGEPLVNAFVTALQSLTTYAAECTTGFTSNAGARARAINEAVGAVTATREAIEMRIYELCDALRDERTARERAEDAARIAEDRAEAADTHADAAALALELARTERENDRVELADARRRLELVNADRDRLQGERDSALERCGQSTRKVINS